ncbi:TlyA family RNA methyltransferase [Marinomonas mediterranea]|jgi:Predicted rRNA methylase|uniref:Ribosomal RNA methyltransferase RrmJ/FtsJ n=1 Tax=Marinomonas mediterranea (strain ATCC 700492 / JCM 21426 / NBRC 103028 / MMB-1) TaxID=717774 RepID=F2K463_MARM1|nr:TlyA family RNA methyltransferase [Marinomonas mediterranea]ADZ92504.1 ribosomal RNA methyltransferase RrmJ/FtsJ [Marinomonas mediterranea MMB-1]WCN10450.1 TlyA family rRNA (cytidine-2'-O)-methyltransferase [Marinomonas mediterranea]WCN14498.1 TlyA family rRNA (cytidine-2'-O)-methyltransferase [Marinomonas mediterranea]WCN18549.1 TlyA family rRNA (cytidine-2'-O)-methyltransferase [Marinomonas mediterranea MMB-1]
MKRIDVLLTESGLAKSRSQAQSFINQKKVSAHINGTWQLITKPSLKLEEVTQLDIQKDESDRYVSRGALKLEGALKQYHIDFKGFAVLDVGQSTGGFTDCSLQHGAEKVVGVEVGHDQLDPTLRNNESVICFEGINARSLDKNDLEPHFPTKGFDAIVMDVSFISQMKILPQLPSLLAENGYLITLVKPQFEVGQEFVSKGGIVKDEQRVSLLKDEMILFAQNLGFTLIAYEKSVIKGGDGNQEYLMIAQRQTPA